MLRKVVLYSRPGCCLCDTLAGKLATVQRQLGFTIEVRDITTDPEWLADFQYTIPVLEVGGRTLSGISHRMPESELAGTLALAFAQSG